MAVHGMRLLRIQDKQVAVLGIRARLAAALSILNYARNARWHLRLAICGLAREVLSAETAPKPRAKLRGTLCQLGRDQWIVLFLTAPECL